MELLIKRKNKLFRYDYEINDGKEWVASANYTYNMLFRKITLTNNITKDVYEFKERSPHLIIAKLIFTCACLISIFKGDKFSFLTMVFMAISLIVLFIMNPFLKFYHNSCYFGHSYIMGSYTKGFKFMLNNTIYSVNSHGDFKASILEKDRQVGLIIRNSVVAKEQNQYKVLYDKNMQDEISLVLLLSLFVDITYYPLDIKKFAFIKKEYNKVLFDKHKDRTTWKPED